MKHKKNKASCQLAELGKNASQWKPAPEYMLINGNITADRSIWLKGAQAYQQKTYVDPEETPTSICNRFDHWRSRAVCDKQEGVTFVVPSVFMVLQALTSMQAGKAVVYGTPPIEFFQYLPYIMKIRIALWMIDYYINLSWTKPSGWNAVQLVGIQGAKKIGGFEKMRWVGKTASSQKWFLKVVVACIEREIRPILLFLLASKRVP